MKKKLFGSLLALTMILSLVSALSITASATNDKTLITSTELTLTGLESGKKYEDIVFTVADTAKMEVGNVIIYGAAGALNADDEIKPFSAYILYAPVMAKDGYRFPTFDELGEMTVSLNGEVFPTCTQPLVGYGKGMYKIIVASEEDGHTDMQTTPDDLVLLTYQLNFILGNFYKMKSTDSAIDLYNTAMTSEDALTAALYAWLYGNIPTDETTFVFAKNGDKYCTFTATLDNIMSVYESYNEAANLKTLAELQTSAASGNVIVLAKDATSAAKIGNTEYETLQEAIDAAKNGETVTLNNDNAENIKVSAEKTFTIDKNGKSYTGTITAAEGYELKKTESGDKVTYTVTAQGGYLQGLIRLIFNFKSIQFFSIGEFLARIAQIILDIFR